MGFTAENAKDAKIFYRSLDGIHRKGRKGRRDFLQFFAFFAPFAVFQLHK